MVGIGNFFLALVSTVCLSPVCDNRRIASSLGIGRVMRAPTGRRRRLGRPVSPPETCPSVPVEGRFSSRSSVSFPADFTPPPPPPPRIRGGPAAALAGVLSSTLLLAVSTAHAADECGDPVEQPDSSWLITCDSGSYDPATEGDIVYVEHPGDHYTLNADDIDIATASTVDVTGGIRLEVRREGNENNTGSATLKMTNGSTIDLDGAGKGVYLLNETKNTGGITFTMEDGSSIATSGVDGFGVHMHRDNIDAGSQNSGVTSATLKSGSSISTSGVGADGIHANVPRGSGAVEVEVKNGASITTTGSGADGIYVVRGRGPLYTNDSSGGVKIDIGGNITTGGLRARGILINSIDGHTKNIEINVTGGEISAMGSDIARAIQVDQHWDQARDGAVAIKILVSNAALKSAQSDAVYIDHREGTTPKTLTLRNATIERTNAGAGDRVVFFTSGRHQTQNADDEIIILGTGTTTIKGDVDMGYGSGDTLTLNTCTDSDRENAQTGDDCHESLESGNFSLNHDGRFRGTNQINKIGSGTAGIHDLDASQSNAAMAIKGGALLLEGHLNLGTGVLTLHDSSRLIFTNTDSEHGRITAAKVKFNDEEEEKIYLAVGASLAANSDLLLGTTKFHDHDDAATAVELYATSGGSKLSDVTAEGVVQTASTIPDGNECGNPPTSGDPRTITCSDSKYIFQSDDPTGVADAGIDYEFSDANNYEINVQDDIDVDTTDASDHGLHAKHTNSGNVSVNMTGGAIDTSGGWRDYGIFAENTSSDITKRNVSVTMSGGSINTIGQYSHGLFAKRDAGAVDITLKMTDGSILATHQEAHGILAEHGSGAGDIDITMSGGSIETSDDGSHGLSAVHEGAGALTVTMSGGSILTGNHRYSNYRKAGRGIDAFHKGSTGNISISLSGNADIKTGQRGADSPTVVGDEAHGVFAKKEGSEGDISVSMTGDGTTGSTITTGKEVNAGTTGRGADGIYVWQTTAGDSEVSLTNGATVTVTDPSAWGIRIRHGGGTGSRHITVADSTISAASSSARAIGFQGGGAKDDTLAFGGIVNITGEITTGGGTDTLTLNSCKTSDTSDATDTDCHNGTVYNAGALTLTHAGSISGLETIDKIGSGRADVSGLTASGATLNLKDGELFIDGHLDLGSDGILNIHDSNKLIFGSTSTTEYGQITAEKVVFDNSDTDFTAKVYRATGATLATGSDLLLGTGKFYEHDGTTEVGPELHPEGTGTKIADVGADGVVGAGAAVDGNECGDVPTSSPYTITCSDTTYTAPDAPGDPGIEYSLPGSDNYTINISGSIDVDTTVSGDYGLHTTHYGGGNLGINMSSGSIDTDGPSAHGIAGYKAGSGNFTIGMSGGTIDTAGIGGSGSGSGSSGIVGANIGSGDLTINMTGGTVKTGTGDAQDTGKNAHGIYGSTYSGVSGGLSINMSGGNIETGFGTGTDAGHSAAGIFTWNYGSNDTSSVTLSDNGSIHTKGDWAAGIWNLNSNTENTATSDITVSGGSIKTEGINSSAVYGTVSGSNNTNITIYDGTVETTGSLSNGIGGSHSGSGNLTIDLTNGTIKTGTGDFQNTGSNSQAISVRHTGTGNLAIDMSGGTIETGFGSGGNAGLTGAGLRALQYGTGTSTVTLSGGSIHTKGRAALGIWTINGGAEDADGNAGTSAVTMSGGTIDTEGLNADGIVGTARDRGNLDIDLTDALTTGACTGTVNTGCEIHIRGNAAYGIHAYAEIRDNDIPSGNIDVDMAGGDILTEGEAAHGIYIRHAGTADDISTDVAVSDGSITTTGTDANPIRFASSAVARTLVLRGATLTAPSAGAAVVFDGTGNDKLTLLGHDTGGQTAVTTLVGDVHMGAGNDTLIFNVCRQQDSETSGDACFGKQYKAGVPGLNYTGEFTGLERISKIGSGNARITDLTSHSSVMDLEKGGLVLSGHLDLGTGGVLNIHNPAKLIFRKPGNTHGTIAAEKVVFKDDDWQKVFAGSSVFSAGDDVLTGDTVFHNNAGNATVPTVRDPGDSNTLGYFTSGGVFTETANPPEPPPGNNPDPNPVPDTVSEPDQPPVLTPITGPCDPDAGRLVSCRTAGIDVLFLTVGEKNDLDFDLRWFPETDSFHKLGNGWARFGDTTLPGGRVSLDEGGLLLKGHLDLGPDGALHIVDVSRLMFGTPDEGPGHGSITAGRVVFIGPPRENGEQVHATDEAVEQLNGERVYATDEAADRLNGAHVLTTGLFVNGTGSVVYPDLYDETGDLRIGRVAPDGLVRVDSTPNPAPLPNPGDCPPGVEICAQEPVDPVIPGRPDNPGNGAPSPCSPGVEVCTQPAPGPGPAPQPEPPAQPEPDPAPVPQPEPDPAPQPEPDPAPKPAPEPPAQPEPDPTPQPIPEPPPQPDPTLPRPCLPGQMCSGPMTGPVAETGVPATVGLASGSMMQLTAAALDQGPATAGASAGPAGFAAGTGAVASPGPWVRALTGGLSARAAGGSVSGLAVGFDTEFGDGFHFGAAIAPEARASSADSRSQLSGDVWTAHLGWSAGGAFADAALAWGRSRARSQSVDAVTGDILDGASGLVQSHVQAKAGHRVSVGGWAAVPSVSLFAGSLEHGARTAHGAVMRTDTPGFTQSYHGWKAGLALGTEDWLDGAGALRWRPHLRADYERTTDEGPETLMVRKADRAGVLSFESEERVERLPRETLRLDLGAEFRGGSDAWGVGVGLSSAWTDGAPEHGVQARFSLRF